jgi:5'-3' exonuclease
MGVGNFQPYIKKVYSKACQKKFEVIYDNLYIDLNHVLHHVCYLSKDKEDLLTRFRDYLRGIITSVKPTKRVILAADGAAPLAKMILQRKRRLDSIKTLEGDIDSKKNLNLNLTPGTEFMMNLEKSLTGFVKYIKEKNSVEVITLITDADEGEIKIKRYLQKLQKKYPMDTHAVYSGDSDTILLLFTCDDLSKVYQMVNKETIIHFGTMYDEHIAIFGKTINSKNDFVFINLMMGNDYLPKVAFLKLEKVWKAYKIVAKNRPTGMVTIDSSNIIIDQIFLHDLLYIACKNVSDHRMKRFKFANLSCTSYNNYVQGLYWCFGMYTTGKCSNYRYIYEHMTSPHVNGVMLSLMRYNTYSILFTSSIDVDLYGIFLIPEKAKSLLSKEQNLIAERLVKEHPIVYEEERCKKCRNYSKLISNLNKELKLHEKGTDERCDVIKRITKLNKKFSTHKKLHKNLSIDIVDKISKSFVKIREELRETMSLDSNPDFDNISEPHDTKNDIYDPNARRNNIFKKKLSK